MQLVMKNGTFLAQRINQGFSGNRRGVSHLVGKMLVWKNGDILFLH
jgi:hypothetical protein